MELILLLLPMLGHLHLVAPDAQVDALYDLRTSLKASPDQLTDWDPNHVIPCAWTQVSCDANDNVVSVSMSFMGFTGSLSPRIRVLSKLTILLLGSNNLSGQIPNRLFQVSIFNFTGNILNCSLNNTHPCTSPSRVVDTSKKSMVGTKIGVIGGVLGLLVLGCLILVLLGLILIVKKSKGQFCIFLIVL